MSDFENYDEAIQAGLRAGEIISVKEPDWHTHPANEMGQAACFQRLDDSSIWIVLLPERASGGYWKKLTGQRRHKLKELSFARIADRRA